MALSRLIMLAFLVKCSTPTVPIAHRKTLLEWVLVNCGSTGQLLTQALEQNSVTDDIDGTHTLLGYTNAINY